MTAMQVPEEDWERANAVGMFESVQSSRGSVDDDLSRFMEDDGDTPDFGAEPVPAESLDQANRWLRAIARLDREADGIRGAADTERKRVEAWELQRLAPLQERRAWLVRSCELLTAALWARDPKTVTYNVPNGKLFSRKNQPEWVIEDDAVFVEWAQSKRPDLVNQPDPPAAKPDRNAIKKAFADVIPKQASAGDEFAVTMTEGDGTVVPVPGVRVVIPERSWKLETLS